MEENTQHNDVNNLIDRFHFVLPFFDDILNKKGEMEIIISNQKLILFWEALG